MENPKRMMIAIVLIAIVVPLIFGFYGMIGEDSPEGILAKLIQSVPFGDSILKVVLLPVSDSMSNYDTFFDWIKAQEFSFSQHLALEMGKLVFSGAILMLVEKIAQKAFHGNGGILDSFADFLLVTLAVFVSCCLTDLLLSRLELVMVWDLSGKLKDAMVYIHSVLLGIGGVGLSILASVMFVDVILGILISCFKMTVTYMGVICVLAYYVKTGSVLISVITFVVWFGLIVGLHKAERGILK